MILYVPEKARLLEAEIQLSDGDFTADQLLCEKMTAQLSDGDLMLDKGVFEKFEAKAWRRRSGCKRASVYG